MNHLAPRVATVAFGVGAAPLRPLLASATGGGRPVFGYPHRSLSALGSCLFGAPPAVVATGKRTRAAALLFARGGGGVGGGGGVARAPVRAAAAGAAAGGADMEDTDDEMPQARSAGGAGVYLSSTVGGRVAAGAPTLAGAAPEPPVEQGGAYAGQIFCNRNLNMAKITAVGFGMSGMCWGAAGVRGVFSADALSGRGFCEWVTAGVVPWLLTRGCVHIRRL